MNRNDILIGHENIYRYFQRCREQERLSHAYVLWGPAHVGKRFFAEKVAREIIGDSRDEGVGNSLRILGEGEAFADTGRIDVDDIRALRRAVALGAKGTPLVYIISHADCMTISAQNAFLKILEEPKENVIFFLTCDVIGKLLPTILSRCERVAFSLVEEESMQQYLSIQGGEQSDLITFSFGRPGYVVEMLGNQELLKDKKIRFRFFETFSQRSARERIFLAESLASHPERVSVFLEEWISYVRRGTRMEKGSVKKQYALIEKMCATRECLETSNAQIRLQLESLFLAL